VLPLYSILILLQLRSEQPISLPGFIVYLGVICPLAVVIVLVLLRLLCEESLPALNLRPGGIPKDLLAAVILSPLIIIAGVVSTSVFSGLFPEAPPSASVRDLFARLAANPRLLLLFLGLLLPLGATSEELVRTFLLSRLWRVWPSPPGRALAVVASACLFGLAHCYQGPVHIAWTTVFGLIAALFYLRVGRVLPLILAHYATNALQVVVFAARSQ